MNAQGVTRAIKTLLWYTHTVTSSTKGPEKEQIESDRKRRRSSLVRAPRGDSTILLIQPSQVGTILSADLVLAALTANLVDSALLAPQAPVSVVVQVSVQVRA